MKKVLYIANTDRHINLCHLPYLKLLKENDCIVHVATNTNESIKYCDKKIVLPITRNPYHISNLIAIIKLKRIIKKEKYDLIHCHTPMGGVVGRMASKHYKKNNKSKIIYTAHGFHFYKGCPIINYLIYYPVEKLLSKWTDLIITMNEEDYLFAQSHFNCKVKKISGIGFDKDKLNESSLDEINQIKKKLKIDKNDFVIIYIAEMSRRKKQLNLIKDLSSIDLKKNNIKMILIGDNDNIKINKYTNDNIIYLPFQNNVSPYLDLADLVISYSRQEGMPLNILEAIYKNKNVLLSNIRGHNDLAKEFNNLYLFNNKKEFIDKLFLLKDNNLNKFKSSKKILKYSTHAVLKEMKDIYIEEDIIK